MKDLAGTIQVGVGYFFGALVIAFTGFQTWSLLFEATGNELVALLGLVLFEGGMLYWWVCFQYTAKGLGQLALSIGMAVLSLCVVSLAAALHLGAVSAGVFGANTVSVLITAAAVMNLGAKFAYPLLSPHMIESIRDKVMEGRINTAVYKAVESKMEDRNADIVEDLSNNRVRRIETSIVNAHYREEAVDTKALPSANAQPVAPLVINEAPKPRIMAAESPTVAPEVVEVAAENLTQANLI